MIQSQAKKIDDDTNDMETLAKELEATASAMSQLEAQRAELESTIEDLAEQLKSESDLRVAAEEEMNRIKVHVFQLEDERSTFDRRLGQSEEKLRFAHSISWVGFSSSTPYLRFCPSLYAFSGADWLRHSVLTISKHLRSDAMR